MTQSLTVADVLSDAFDRIQQSVHRVLDGLTDEQLSYQPTPGANSMAWLIWHLTRVQDDHVADAAGSDQVWLTTDWYDKFGLPLDRADTGYGHQSADVSKVVASAELLAGYHDAVHSRTKEYVSALTEADLGRIVDDSWDPPVSLAVRLVSVFDDDMQHVGQAAYLRGQLPS